MKFKRFTYLNVILLFFIVYCYICTEVLNFLNVCAFIILL